MERDPRLGAPRQIHRRHDPDDREGLFEQTQALADHVARAVVAALPEPLVNHEHPFGADHVVGGQQRPAEERRHVEDAEEVAVDDARS